MLQRRRIGIVAVAWVVSWASLSQHAAGLDANSTDPRAILKAALDAQVAARSTSRLKMSIQDRSGARERLLSVWSQRADAARKTLILIEQPAELRNTGFLSVDYRANGQADEQWLYMPKLHRVSRVPPGGKANAFVGSDFSIFDLSQQDPDNYEVAMVDANAKVGDEACWSIEGRPRSDGVRRDSGYEKTQFWISKSKLAVLQMKATLAGGKRAKYFKATDVRNKNGTWTPHRLQMRTLEGESVVSETTVDVLAVDNDAKAVSDDDFTQQRLERGI